MPYHRNISTFVKFTIITLLFASKITLAQNVETKPEAKAKICSPFYIGFSTGLNNRSGLIGLNVEVPAANQFSFSSGVGFGTWGCKTYGEAIIYFNKNCHRGGAFSFGATHSFGSKNMVVGTNYSSIGKDVIVSGNGATNGFASFYHFFNIGKHGSKLYLQLGYSARLKKPVYTVTSKDYGYPIYLSDDGYKKIDALAGGGVILAFGIMLGSGN